MSQQSQQQDVDIKNNVELDEAAVSQYLEQHPDFFTRHADLLSRLEINHDSGTAVSLIERQVFVLRDKNQRLENKLSELVRCARENEQLSRNILQLVVDLLWAEDLESLLSAVIDALRHEFQVDFASIHLMTDDQSLCDEKPQWYLHKDDPRYEAISSVVESNRPVCGRLSREQINCMFTDFQDEIQSAALIPLVSGETLGFIGLGGQSEFRFTPAMATNFLHQIGELVSAAIGTYLQK